MIPLAAVLAEKARNHFDLEVRHAGVALGSPEAIQEVLTSAGYVDIQVGSHFGRLHALAQVRTGKRGNCMIHSLPHMLLAIAFNLGYWS